MKRIQFWLVKDERLRLPVNPESISVSTSHGYEDVLVSHLGEYTIIGENELDQFSISSFFPKEYHPSYCEYENIPDPWDAVQTIQRWKTEREPIRLTITGTPINTLVTIRSFNYEAERAGHIGDIYYDLELKQYVRVKINRVSLEQQKAKVKTTKAAKRPNPKAPSKVYIVRKGDSLYKIAKKELSDSSRWREIYELNKKTIGKNPNLIYPGQKLVLPS